MNNLIYWGVVLAGAVTLLIEANRNYSQSLSSIPFGEHPILQSVEVGKLSTRREKNIGFAFYSLLYLVTYIVVLSSAEIYDLLHQAWRVEQEVGPTDTILGSGGGPLSEAGYGKPIFVSAAIIAIFSVGALRPVEATMRSLAHRLAGIPRGVYKIIDDLHSIPYQDFDELKGPKILAKMFNTNSEQAFRKSFDAEQIDTVVTALLTIDYLSPAVTGKQRVQHFPFTQLDAMSDLAGKLDDQVLKLRGLLSDPDPDAKKRADIYSAAMGTANDSIALFALHFLRNNRAIKNFGKGTAIAAIYDEIRNDYPIELNSFGMGLVFSLVAALISGYLIVYAWSLHANRIDRDTMKPTVEQVLENDIRFTDEADRKKCLSARPGGGELEAGENDGRQTECEQTWKQVIDTKRNERRKGVMMFVFSGILPVWFSVAVAALSALLGRDVRREDNSWQEWPLRRFPFMRILSLSVVPAILAVFCVGLGQFIALWIDAGLHLTENQMTFFFVSKGPFFLMHALLGIVVAVGVLVLADQHDRLHNETTVLIGLIFGLLALLGYYIIVLVGYQAKAIHPTPSGWPWFGFETREVLVYGSCAFFFLVFFSIFLEITENIRADRGSFLLSFFRSPKIKFIRSKKNSGERK